MFQHTKYLVKERVAFMKLTDTFDILDPATGQPIGLAEEHAPAWVHLLRFLLNKQMLPTTVEIREAADAPSVLTIHRGFPLFRSRIDVTDSQGQSIGYFKSKLLSLGGGFHVFDAKDQAVAEIKGNWKGWDFQLLSKDGRLMGTVTKKWGGIGKELLTSADSYMIAVNDEFGANPGLMALLLAAGLAIDIVFKER